MVDDTRGTRPPPGRVPWAVYLRASGAYLGTFVAQSKCEAIGRALDYHGYPKLLELAGVDTQERLSFEVIWSPAQG